MQKLNTELEQFIYNIWDFNSESGEWPEYYKGVSEMIQIRDARIRAEASGEAATKARNAILDFGKGDTVSSRYSPMIRKEMAAQLAERAILGGTKRE